MQALGTNQTGDRQTVAHTQPAWCRQPALPEQILSRRKLHFVREITICYQYGVGLLREYPCRSANGSDQENTALTKNRYEELDHRNTGPFLIFSILLRRLTVYIRIHIKLQSLFICPYYTLFSYQKSRNYIFINQIVANFHQFIKGFYTDPHKNPFFEELFFSDFCYLNAQESLIPSNCWKSDNL